MQSRRSFLQAAAAAFSGVALGRLGETTAPEPQPIDYSRFCDHDGDSWRYDLAAPFSQNGMIVATDSKILISHPGELSGGGTARVPDVGKLWWGEFDARGWVELPPPRIEETRDHWSRCVHCLGADCSHCEEGWTRTAERLYGVGFSTFCMDALRRLGPIETRILRGVTSACGVNTAVLLFRGPCDVRGFLMPFYRSSDGSL